MQPKYFYAMQLIIYLIFPMPAFLDAKDNVIWSLHLNAFNLKA